MTSNNTPAELITDIRAALAELDNAITGHTGNNLVENAYRHAGFRLPLAEVMEWLATGNRLYDGPSRTDFAGMGKVTNEQRASWYHIPDRATASARVAATLARYGLPDDHMIATTAPSQVEVKAMLGSADPLAKLAEIHAEAAKREAERIKAEREKRIKQTVAAAQALAKFKGDPALPFAQAIEEGADRAELAQAFTNAGLPVPPEDAAKPGKPAAKK